MTDSASPKPAHKKSAPKNARRCSRELALQGLYQWLLSGEEAAVVMAHIAEQDGFDKCDRVHLDALLNGSIEQAKEFGGTDGHKYVNGVLDKCATELRPNEPRAARR